MYSLRYLLFIILLKFIFTFYDTILRQTATVRTGRYTVYTLSCTISLLHDILSLIKADIVMRLGDDCLMPFNNVCFLFITLYSDTFPAMLQLKQSPIGMRPTRGIASRLRHAGRWFFIFMKSAFLLIHNSGNIETRQSLRIIRKAILINIPPIFLNIYHIFRIQKPPVFRKTGGLLCFMFFL